MFLFGEKPTYVQALTDISNCSQCHSFPNAPLPDLEYGLLEYMSVGIDAKKLIPGLPW